MGIIAKISFRNLTRQKRRNALLGLGIGFGMSILVIANSFANGLVDVLINDLVSRVAGHIQVNSYEKSKGVFRDKEKIEKVLAEHKDLIIETDENVGAYTKIVGNGKSLSAPIVGVKNQKGFFGEYLQIIEGDVKDYSSDTYDYPVVLSPDKAKALNTKVGDTLKARFNTITGQVQAVNLQVIAIATTNSSFMDFVLYMDAGKMRKLLGYNNWESGPLQLTIKDPEKNAKKLADEIQNALKPDLLNVVGAVNGNKVKIYGFNNNDESKNSIFSNLKIIEGNKADYTAKAGVLISESLKSSTGLKIGDKLPFSYESKFYGTINQDLKISGIFKEEGKFTKDLIVVNAERVYKFLNENKPKTVETGYFTENDKFYGSLAKEYKLLDRAENSDGVNKLSRAERVLKSDRARYSVNTMYETASQLISVKFALSVITWVVVLILFFIILIGVVNTLRMTVKERTREIGTLRAIGMQAVDVKNSFILESIYLTVMACVGGAFVGYIITKGLGAISFDSTNPLSFILKEKHIYFQFNITDVFVQGLVLVGITAITAYFPSRKASKIKPSEALRHVE